MERLAFSYDSLGAAIAAAESDKKPQWAKRASRRGGNADWYGTDSFESAVALARHGWPEGRARLKRAAGLAVMASRQGQAPAYQLDVAGAYPVPALAAAGAPDCMFAPAPINERARPIARLLISGAVSSFMRREHLDNYGAAIAAFVDGLESENIRAELTLAFIQSQGRYRACHKIRIKESGDPLEMDRLAFVLANTAFYRRLFFSIMETTLPACYGSGYGTPGAPDDTETEPGQILIPSAQSFRDGLDTPEAAWRTVSPKIRELLAGQGDFPPIKFMET
jgi:hypothetical protein